MADPQQDHRKRWQPPPRPEWVRRINEEGDCMDIRGVVPLDESSLLESAMRSTGLSDFGSDEWREPFRVYIKALEDEARLNLLGRLRLRGEVLQMLKARLCIEDAYKRHPEIDDEQINQPLLVVGQGRSGTSFLVNVLASSPDNGALLQWESMTPCPPPEAATYRTDPRIAQADKLIKQWDRVTPEMKSMHEWSALLPQECDPVMAFAFYSATWLNIMAQVPSFDAYMMKLDPEPGIRYLKRILKLLQWRNPRRHWVLKDVRSLDIMPSLLKVFPDMCFIWPHRDPVRSLASAVNLVGTCQWGNSDHPFNTGSFEFIVDPRYSAQRLDAVIDQLESGAVPERQIFHLLYKDLVGDTMGSLHTLYDHFGIPLTDAGRHGMEAYLRDNPRTARPRHQFDIGTDEAVALARQAYRRYQEKFSIPNE